MDDRTFNLLVDRLERIEEQNDRQLNMLEEHHRYVDDARNAVLTQVDILQETVNTHRTYFNILGWIGAPAIATAVGYLFTKLGFK